MLCPASFPPPFGACHPCGAGTRGWTQAWPGPPAGETGRRCEAGLAARPRAREPGRGADIQIRVPTPSFPPDAASCPTAALSPSSPPAPGPSACAALGSTGQGERRVQWWGGHRPGPRSVFTGRGLRGTGEQMPGSGWGLGGAICVPVAPARLLRGGGRATYTAHTAGVADASRPRPALRTAGTLWARLGSPEAVLHVTEGGTLDGNVPRSRPTPCSIPLATASRPRAPDSDLCASARGCPQQHVGLAPRIALSAQRPASGQVYSSARDTCGFTAAAPHIS